MWGVKAACWAMLLPASGNAKLNSRRIAHTAAVKARSAWNAAPASDLKPFHSCKEHGEFMSWMKNRGEDVDCIAVAVGMSEHGRALFASRPICAGESMIKFSQNLVLTPEKLPEEVTCLLQEANEFTRVSLLLMAEKQKGQASAWAPYIDCLPSFGEIHSTIFWDQNELICLSCSHIYRGTVERNALINFEFKEVQNVVEACSHVYGNCVSPEDFKHAYATVSSRAWGEGPHSVMTMIPFVDFANHNPRTRAVFSPDAEDNSKVVVVADRDYQIGDEVHISYGDHSNVVLALDYGFVVPDNPFDEAEIWLEIPFEDPLRDWKLDYLVQNNMHTLRNDDGSQSGGLNFMITEVSMPGGREVVVPSAARAFARVICSDSVEDLEELDKESEIFQVVPFASRPRQNRRKEARATTYLGSIIQTHIEEHARALQSVQSQILRPERRYMAECVLQGELQLLQKAIALLAKQL